MASQSGSADYLAGLDPDQRAAATAPMGPVCILAGAGTGKTRTITHRIKYLIDQGFVPATKILAVSFTQRAAGEMRDRLASMGAPGVQARTFHSAAMRQLSYFWPQVAGDMPWELLDRDKFRVTAQAVRRAGVDGSKENIRDVMGEIDWAKAMLISPEDYAAAVATHGRGTPFAPQKVADCYRIYEDLKTTPERIYLDFNDLLIHTAAMMENSRAVAEQFRSQYRCFVVDEYQDVTPLQQRVLRAWLGERDNLTVVGDANQTIYSFTGATPKFLMNFSRDYPEATVARLQRDYRSTPQIVQLANDVIDKAQGRIAGSRLKLVAQVPDGPEPTFTQYDDELMEARTTARTIKRLIDGGLAASEIAILYRINAQSAVFEQALGEVGVAYEVRGGEGFYQRPEVREAISALVRVSRPAAQLTGADLLAYVKEVFAKLGMVEKEPEGAGARERWQSLRALFELCRDILHAGPELNIQALLGQLHTRQEAKQPPTLKGVTLASLHAAKGLEWDAVFLVGLSDGSLPIQHALKKTERSHAVVAEEIEEERRLFYVGITRARRHLELSWSLARAEGGRKTRRRSRFLDGLAIDIDNQASRPEQSPRRRRSTSGCKECGGPLRTDVERISGRCSQCPSAANPELVEALRLWRREVAQEKTVPAFVVFSDATLTAIAEEQPTTAEELLRIPGIGEAKLAHYGDGVLALVNSFQQR